MWTKHQELPYLTTRFKEVYFNELERNIKNISRTQKGRYVEDIELELKLASWESFLYLAKNYDISRKTNEDICKYIRRSLSNKICNLIEAKKAAKRTGKVISMDQDDKIKNEATISTKQMIDSLEDFPVMLSYREKLVLAVWCSETFRTAYPRSRTIKQDKKNIALFLGLKIKEVGTIIEGLHEKLSK